MTMSKSRSKILKSKSRSTNTCFCKEESELPYLTATPGCSEDIAAVSVLPEHWVPRRSGPILVKYLKQREQSHQHVIECLFKDSKLINDEINGSVRTLAEFLLADIQQNQRDIDCVLQKYTSSEESLNPEDRTKAMTQINILVSRRLQSLINFKLEALTLERNRATALKGKLQLYFQKLIAIGYKSPKALLHEFDEKIYDINQQLMSNCRINILLEIKLRSQADKCLVDARSVLNELSLTVSTLRRDGSAAPWFPKEKHLQRSTSLYEDHDIHTTDHGVAHCPDDGTHNSDVVKSQTKIIEGYQDTILKMFKAITSQLDELYKEIEDHNIIVRECSKPVISAIQNIVDKAYHSLGFIKALSKDISRLDYVEMPRSTVEDLQKSLLIFGENLQDTYLILYNAGHLWDAHMIRLALAQKLTMATVEDLIVNHDALQLCNEIVTDIAIEQMRGAPDAEKLQQYFEVITVGLDRTTDLYKLHNEQEVDKLQEFTNLTSSLTNTLLAEFICFLERYPRSNLTEIKSAPNTQVNGSPRNSITFGGSLFISKGILQTELQNVALNNWRNGFLESFEINMSMVPDQLNQQTQLWVDERMDVLLFRYSLKLMSHSVRKERIDVAREIRLAELQFHEIRLNSHLDAIYGLVDSLPVEAMEFINLDAPELYPLVWWTTGIQTNINELFARDPLDPEIKRLKMCSYSSRLINHRQLFLNSLESAVLQYKKSIEYKIQVARISNVSFMSQLKLFSEGGKYSASEATRACTALVRAADALELCVHRILDCVHQRRAQILILADQKIAPIQRIVDEALKSTQKGILDKRKLATLKK